jgi:hypothetical protein
METRGLQKSRLVELTQSIGLCALSSPGSLEDCVGDVFERFVLRSFNLQRNRGPGLKPDVWTYLSRMGVVPDAVFPVARVGGGGPAIFPASGFLEVKAIQPGVLRPSSFEYQLSVMIDVLSESPAALAGTPGAFILVTTSGVTISNEFLLDASTRKVAFWHAEVKEIIGKPPIVRAGYNDLQVGQVELLNPIVFQPGFSASEIMPPKVPGGLLGQ